MERHDCTQLTAHQDHDWPGPAANKFVCCLSMSAENETRAPPKRKGDWFRTTWLWFNCIIWCILTGVPGILCILLVPFIGLSAAQKLTWRCSVVFFKIVLWAAGCPYTVSGLENLDLKKSYFFASNHESVFDVPLLFSALPFWLISVIRPLLFLFSDQHQISVLPISRTVEIMALSLPLSFPS
jgi:hypothetical protein